MLKRILSPLMLAIALLCTFAFSLPSVQGQEKSQATPPQQEGVVQQSMVIQAADDGSGAAPRVQFYSSSMDGGPVMLGNLSTIGPSDPFSLANNKSVQKEIELVDEQLQQMKEINKDFSERMQSQIKELTSGKMEPGRGKELGELISKMQAEKQEKLKGVLLPHQFDRLHQIALQNRMKQSGESNVLTSKKLMDELGIDEKQKKRLRERSKELKEEMEREIKKLKAKARESLMKELTSDQRKKLDEMLGDSFEVKRESFAERFKLRRDAAEKESSDQ